MAGGERDAMTNAAHAMRMPPNVHHQVPVSKGATSRGSLRDLLASPAVLAIVIVNFVNHWGYFIYLNWMPSFFYKVCIVALWCMPTQHW